MTDQPSLAPPAPSTPLTLRDLSAIGVERLKGVGDKKLASLHEVGVFTVLDLLTPYPRRWVDRTNECRVGDLVPVTPWGSQALSLLTQDNVGDAAAITRLLGRAPTPYTRPRGGVPA